MSGDQIRASGGCHCGAVRFEVTVPRPATAQACNCSICAMTGFVHLIVPASAFHLASGEDTLTEYRFNTGTARHLFCRVCGIKSFYVPRSNPDGFSVNLNCLDSNDGLNIQVEAFDGRHWEDNAARLEHLSD